MAYKTKYDGRQYVAKFNKNSVIKIDGDSELPEILSGEMMDSSNSQPEPWL